MQHGSTVIDLVVLVGVLLFIAGAVRAFTKRVNLPFTVVLVVVGLVLR